MTSLQLKRSRSDDNFERPSKFSKIKDNIFSFFGFTSSNKNFIKSDDDDDDDDEQQRSSPSSSPSSNSKATKAVLNNQITAKQLSDFYEQLRRENSTLSSNLTSQRESTPNPAPETEKTKPNNHNDTVLSNQAESTIIQNEAKEEKEQQDQEQIVPPLSTSTELSNTDKACTNTKPLFTIDPLERANLIHLKKMLELEKYRKLRMKYMQEHTRHLKNNLNDKLNCRKSGPTKLNINTQSKKRNWNDLPEERKNKEGSFGISLIEDVEDDDDGDEDEELEVNQKKLNSHSLLKKIKFNETDKLSDFDTANKPKSFVPNKANEKKERTYQNVIITKPVHKIPVEPVKNIDAPTVAFDFGKKKEENAKTFNDKIDGESFKVNALSTENTYEPSFSFGQPAVSSVEAPSAKTEKSSAYSFSFAKPIHTPKVESKSSFTLTPKKNVPSLFPQQAGSKAQEAVVTPIKDGEVLNTNPSSTINFKNNNTIPSINFGKPIINKEESQATVPVSTPSFDFGSTNMEKEVKHSAPSFNFGMSTEKKEGDKQVVPSFNFSASTKKVNDKPSFSFGQPATAQKNDEKKGMSTPFSFESKLDSSALTNSAINNVTTIREKKVESKPLFNSSTKNNDIPKPAFSFGKNSEVPKMNFGFGTSSDFNLDTVAQTGLNSSTPAFNFGEETEKKDDKKPKMAIGSSNATSNTSNNATAFNFGGKKPVLPSVEKKDETAPVFGHGEPDKPSTFESEDSEESALKRKKISQNGSAPPVFNLNASKVQSAAFANANNGSLSSTFGATTNGTNNAATGFNFGVSKSASPAPNTTDASGSNNSSSKNFSFGQTSTTKPPGTGFALNITTTDNGIGFGQTKNPGFGFTSSSGTATAFGQSGTNGFANNMNQNQNQVQPQASSKIFSSISSKFTSQLPSITAGFNNNNNNNNNNTGFGGINNGFGGGNNNGFGGGNNNGFGGNINSAFGSNTGFAGNTNVGFDANSRSLSGTNSGFGNNSGFGSANNGFGSNNHINVNTNNMGSNSRSATPNIDFTGQQTGQIDPNAIFSGTSSATPPPQNARRKAFPRSMRNRR